ncbi:MAG: gamma-glutamyltransferase family protein, partial [Gammaproteobacteria bacterium]
PALGQTYARLAQHGFEDFYRGGIAEALAAYLGRHGAALDANDLAAHTVDWVTPISTTYRGHEVFELPPNGQGLAVIEMLNLLEHFPLAEFGAGSVDYWHVFIEAKKLAFEDRARYYADPAFAEVPVAALAGKAYAAERVGAIGERAAAAPAHGHPGLSRGDTTYLSVGDADGMMVSLIQSVFKGFGSGLTPPDLGFALQCRGGGFTLDPAHPNCYAPGKRPFHTIIPAFVKRAGEPLMSLGVMGADMQPQGQVEVLVNLLDFGLDVHAAGAAPRLRHDGANAPNLAAAPDAGRVLFEQGIGAEVVAGLEARGHALSRATDVVDHFMGGYQCVRRAGDGYLGASEPRFDGCALGC